MKVDLAHLEALLAVVDEGTFEGAAAMLQVTPSAVSQRLKALEQQAGRVLLRRTRPVQPTEAAIPYLQAARQIQAVVDHTLIPGIDPDSPPPAIPLAANSDSLETWLVSALASVRDVATFHLHRDDQDYTADLLRSGRVMAGVTSHEAPVQGCESTRLGVMRYLPLASPEYVEQWLPAGLTKKHLAAAPAIYYDKRDNLQREFLDSLFPERLNPPYSYMPSNTAFKEAILQDMGWGMVPEQLATDLIDSGQAMHLGGHTDVTLFWQQWKISSTQLDSVRTAVLDAAAYSLRIT